MKSIHDRIKELSPEHRALFERKLKEQRLDAASLPEVQPAIPRRHHNRPSPLSFDQERLWFFNRMHPESFTYNVYGAARLKGTLHLWALEQGINEIVRRHEAWRTVFDRVDPLQRVLPELQVTVPVVDLSPYPAEEREARAQEGLREEVQQLFDLEKGPLIRFKLFILSDTEAMLALTIHHIVIDRITFSIFFEELMVHYKAALEGRTAELPELPVQYADYAEWQREYLQGENRERLLGFWKEQLKDCDTILDIETDFPRPPAMTYRGARVFLRTPLEVLNRLKGIAKGENATAFMILMAAFQTLLFRYTGQDDILVGTPLANRSRVELERVMGYFLTMGTLRSRMDGRMSFLELLRSVRETALAVYKHGDMPVGLLLDELRIPADPSRNPLVQAVFVYVDVPEEKFTLPGLEVSTEMIDGETAKYDVTIGLSETEHGLEGFLEYSPDLFRKETFERMAAHWDRLLRSIAEHPERPLCELAMLGEEELRELTERRQRKECGPAAAVCLHHWFEEQAALYPDRTAVIDGEVSLTYAELNRRANQVAHLLKRSGVGAETLVGLLVERSPQMIAAILGILKAGGAYVAMDPAFPQERITGIVSGSGMRYAVTDDAVRLTHPSLSFVLELDDSWSSVDAEEGGSLPSASESSSLAYVLYTSGSTGAPKGVAMEHGSICNAVQEAMGLFGLKGAQDGVMLQFASPTFDASVLEMFCPLSTGAALCLVSPEARAGGEALRGLLERHRVTTVLLTPPILSTLKPEELPASLRTVVTGGEVISFDVNGWLRDGRRMINIYGPTETAVFVTAHEFTPDGKLHCIGTPIANTQVYLLDAQMQPVPVGVRGELYVGGANLARGYLGLDQETSKRFTADPFGDGRLYRTGDYAKWLPDGTIAYLGRRDDQLKINGIRVERGEIEWMLQQHPRVIKAAVAPYRRSLGGQGLCAYYTSEAEIDSEELRALLFERLPSYMIPAHYLRVEQFPLTTSGKLDLKKLPEPAVHDRSAAAYVPPESELEKLIASIWEEVLGAPDVGLHDNFFSLGGDSIMAIGIASRLYKSGWEIDMKQLFIHPVLKDLMAHIQPVTSYADQLPVTGEIAETPITSWFFEEAFTDPDHWNQAVIIRRADGFDEYALRQAMSKLAEHHDILRCTVLSKWNRGAAGLYNRPVEDWEPELHVIRLLGNLPPEQELAVHANRLHESMQLEHGSLWKAALFRAEDGDHLLFVAHHLVMDWVSWRILLEDLDAAYGQAAEGREIRLPSKTDSYQRWARELQKYARSSELLRQIPYWKSVEDAPCEPIPSDYTGIENLAVDERTLSVRLTGEETEALLKGVHHAYKTEINDILLTAAGLTLKEWTSSDRIMLGMEGHGREPIIKGVNVNRTVGWFTSQYPVVLEISREDDLSYSIRSVKEQLRQIPRGGVGYGILKYLTPEELKEGLQCRLRPEIGFNYLGQIDRDLQREHFGASAYPTGRLTSLECERTAVVLITAYVREGCLHLLMDYNRRIHKEETVAALLEKLRTNLLAVIRHCSAQSHSEETPSDLGYGSLSLEELDGLYDLVESIE
ncbi:non-ribosomal peptide synthetase [Paenibacillus caseinilyticus]|uniref:Tyrocidine synthetase n=1 Tax=Paenibacillus mucilaginosus K02 TaxID=997761 RepID=I0BLV2_9BACL|nr:non-ribosomal peptide synthetase [Paenibacillus mucilaginosus]AFH63349.1 tyrocidine synthetase [Paenibacillus mucilaginosus K02]